MEIVTVAVAIVAAALGGATHWGAARAGAGASLAVGLALLVFGLVWAAGPAVLRLG